MELIKIKDRTNGAIRTVKKSLASDYIGTGKFEIYIERKIEKRPEIKPVYRTEKEEK